MPWLLRDTPCPVCDGYHDFCEPHYIPIASWQYEFMCPTSRRRGVMVPTVAAEPMRTTPTDAVMIRKSYMG
jgi:hypothetical protein